MTGYSDYNDFMDYVDYNDPYDYYDDYEDYGYDDYYDDPYYEDYSEYDDPYNEDFAGLHDIRDAYDIGLTGVDRGDRKMFRDRARGQLHRALKGVWGSKYDHNGRRNGHVARSRIGLRQKLGRSLKLYRAYRNRTRNLRDRYKFGRGVRLGSFRDAYRKAMAGLRNNGVKHGRRRIARAAASKYIPRALRDWDNAYQYEGNPKVRRSQPSADAMYGRHLMGLGK